MFCRKSLLTKSKKMSLSTMNPCKVGKGFKSTISSLLCQRNTRNVTGSPHWPSLCSGSLQVWKVGLSHHLVDGLGWQAGEHAVGTHLRSSPTLPLLPCLRAESGTGQPSGTLQPDLHLSQSHFSKTQIRFHQPLLKAFQRFPRALQVIP